MQHEIEDLMRKHHIWGLYRGGKGDTSVNEESGHWVLKFGDMPNLAFFVELSDLCRVPLTSIRTHSESYSGGCDTCGYGAGNEITAYVPQSALGKGEG